MKKQFAALIFALLPAFASAAALEVPLDKVDIDLRDKAAMQDGACSSRQRNKQNYLELS